MGMDQEAAMLGHDGAAKRLAAKLDGKGYPGSREGAAPLPRVQPRIFPPPPKFPSGISRDAGPDQSRTMTVRVGGVAVAQSASFDAGGERLGHHPVVPGDRRQGEVKVTRRD